MVTSSRNSDQWIFPGGGLEPEETPTMAAMREVTEEAGVRGRLDRCLGTFENQERKHRTAVYVMIVTEELAEWDDARNIGRKRKWFSLDEAMEILAAHKPSHLNYLSNLKAKSKMNHETDNGAETS
jgi:diphosphoinositol-polyphosphate diphosphatase